MNHSRSLKAAIPLIPNLICRPPLWYGCLLVTLGLGSLALSPVARAVEPAPDGGFPNQNTAEGDSALFSLTTGSAKTELGFVALFSLATGFANTASGYQALYNNTAEFNTATGYRALF